MSCTAATIDRMRSLIALPHAELEAYCKSTSAVRRSSRDVWPLFFVQNSELCEALLTQHGGSSRVQSTQVGGVGGAARLRGGPLDVCRAASRDRTAPGGMLCAGSCHDRVELARAARLGLDFAVFGPIAATPSHPDATPLGWPRVAELLRATPLPVYAPGRPLPQRPRHRRRRRARRTWHRALRRAAWN